MLMRLYLVATREAPKANADIPKWEVLANPTDYSRAAEQYELTSGEKILLLWEFTGGITILRARFLNINMMDGMSNLDVRFDALPGVERTGLLSPIHSAVTRAINGE